MTQLKKLYIASLVLTLVIGGCKVGPNYQAPENKEPEAYRSISEYPQTDSLLNIRWWEMFDDTVLDTLIATALVANQDALIAAKRVERAQTELAIQKAELLPKINAQANYTYGNYSGFLLSQSQGNWYGGANLNWEIDFWGKFRRLNEASLAEYLATDYAKRTVELGLIAQVASTYFTLLEYDTRLNIAKKTLQSRDSSLQIIENRFKFGIVPEIDLNQAQIQRAIAASSVPLYERLRAQTENALSVLVGDLPGDIEIGKTLHDQTYDIEIPVGLPSQLLIRRPDVAQAEQLLIAQNARIGVAQAQRLPAISLTGLLGASNDLGAVGTSNFAWNAGGSLLSPIFHFGQNKRRVQVQRIKTEEVRYEYEKTVLNAFKEVEDALIEIETLKREVIARQDHVRAAMNAEKLSELRYDKGVTSYLEFLENQRQSFDAQNAFAKSKQELLTAWIVLYKVLGGGWISPEEEQKALEAQNQENDSIN